MVMAQGLSALQVLQSYQILPEGSIRASNDSTTGHEDDDDTVALHALLDGFCTPPVSRQACRQALQLARLSPNQLSDVPSLHFDLPEQPTICVTTATTTGSNNININSHTKPTRSRIVALLQDRRSSSSSKHQPLPVLLQLPVHFASALMRLLVRLLSYETDADYHAHCFWITANNNNNDSSNGINIHQEPAADPDHVTQRPHLPYSVARFQCTWIHALQQSGDSNSRSIGSSSQSINNDACLAVQTVLTLWERVVFMDSAASDTSSF